MKIEMQLDEKGFCKELKIDGISYGTGIERICIDCEYKTRIDMFVHPTFFNESKLEENKLINIYESKK